MMLEQCRSENIKGCDMALKTNVKWGAKNASAKYSVKGKTLRDVVKVLNKQEEWGKFKWYVSNAYKTAGGSLASVTIKPTWSITMPKWPGYAKSSKAVKTSWDTMWKELFKHEEGHRKIFEDDVKTLIAEITKKSPGDADDFTSIFDDALDTMDKNQKSFDKKTKHGKNTIKLDLDAK